MHEVHKLIKEGNTKGPVMVFTKDLTVDEADCMPRDFQKGEEIYRYIGATYGCIGYSGVACSLDGGTPFFEVPLNALSLKES